MKENRFGSGYYHPPECPQQWESPISRGHCYEVGTEESGNQLRVGSKDFTPLNWSKLLWESTRFLEILSNLDYAWREWPDLLNEIVTVQVYMYCYWVSSSWLHQNSHTDVPQRLSNPILNSLSHEPQEWKWIVFDPWLPKTENTIHMYPPWHDIVSIQFGPLVGLLVACTWPHECSTQSKCGPCVWPLITWWCHCCYAVHLHVICQAWCTDSICTGLV